jgi:hypothetical protein
MTSYGEEAISFGSASAIRLGRAGKASVSSVLVGAILLPFCVGVAGDMVFAQYREPGVLMWRGFTLENFADQVRSHFINDPTLGLTGANPELDRGCVSASATRMDTVRVARCRSTTDPNV